MHFIAYFISNVPILLITIFSVFLHIPENMAIFLFASFSLILPFIYGIFIIKYYKFESKSNLITKWIFGLKHLFFYFLVMFLAGIIIQIPAFIVIYPIYFILKLKISSIAFIIYVIVFYPIFLIVTGYFLKEIFYLKQTFFIRVFN